MHQGVLTVLLIAAASALQAEVAPADAESPNIVIILADDMGYGDLSAYNPESKIPTPNLDALADTGLVFTDAHAGGSTCIPSRYALLTGRFPARRSTLRDKAGPIVAEGRATLASMLRDCGYRTAMVGKWHLGFDQKARKAGEPVGGFAFDYDQPLTGGPMDRGFTSFFGMHASLDIPPYFYIRDRAPVMPPTETISHGTSVGGPEGWNRIQGAFWREGSIAPDFTLIEVTPRFAEEASRVIESHDHAQPLFLYLALPSPHTPWLPPREFVGKSGAGRYGDFTLLVDHVVGQILRSLDKAAMRDNTLVLFSSDNGPVWYDKDVQRFGHRSTGPLRGAKGSVWEGGHRVPFIANWPAGIRAGGRSNHTISFVDLVATCAELAGQEMPMPGAAEDSVSFVPALRHPERDHPARPPILHGRKVIRDGDWKLIATRGSRGFTVEPGQTFGMELYNLREDLSETNNLVHHLPGRVDTLRTRLSALIGD